MLVTILNLTNVEINAPSEPLGETALHIATQKGLEECIAILLCAGANPSQKRFDQTTPLQTANYNPTGTF